MEGAELTKQEKRAVDEYLISKGLPTNIAVTFSDVALPDRYSTIRSRSEVNDFHSHLTKGLTLGIPLVSSNMESVTGADMAIALAREGGLGFLPQMLPIETRVEIIEKVRRTDSAFIEEPLTIHPDKTLKEAKQLMRQFGLWSVVAVDGRGHPVGMLSTRDWKYEDDESKKVRDLMSSRIVTAPTNVSFARAAEVLRKHKIE